MTIGSDSSPRNAHAVVDGMTFAEHQSTVRSALTGAGADAGPADLGDWAGRICAVATEMLSASGVTVTAAVSPALWGAIDAASLNAPRTALADRRRLIRATDFSTRVLDDAQGTLDEGPGIDAAAQRRAILVPDFAVDGLVRWPTFAPLALQRGVRAQFAFPLRFGIATSGHEAERGIVGVFGVIRSRPGPLSARQRWLAEALADSASDALTDALFDDLVAADAGPTVEGPEHAAPRGGLAALTSLYLAQHIVMNDLRVPMTEAIARLRQYASEHQRRPCSVAQDIVAGSLSSSELPSSRFRHRQTCPCPEGASGC